MLLILERNKNNGKNEHFCLDAFNGKKQDKRVTKDFRLLGPYKIL